MTIPPNMTVDHALQDALTFACKRARFLAGWEARYFQLCYGNVIRVDIDRTAVPLRKVNTPPEKPVGDFLELNGDGFRGLKDNAFRLALKRANGNKAKAAELLQIQRGTFYNWYRNCSYTVVALLFLLLPLLGHAQTNASVTLAWDASPDTNVVGYRIYWGVASGNYTNSQTGDTNLTMTITNLVRLTTYYFVATAFDAQEAESEYSNECSYTVPAEGAGQLMLRRATTNILRIGT